MLIDIYELLSSLKAKWDEVIIWVNVTNVGTVYFECAVSLKNNFSKRWDKQILSRMY